MKFPSAELRPARHTLVIVLSAAAVFSACLSAPRARSQAAATSAANPALDALLVKLKTQQDTLVANQTKIEAQTALLKENLRQAKIFAARSGGRR